MRGGIGIRTRLLLTSLVSLAGLVVLALVAAQTMRSQMTDDRVTMVRNLTEIAGNLVQRQYDRFAAGEIDESTAKARAVDALGDADGAATLAAFTIEATVASVRHFKETPVRWLVCGGGRRNIALMRALEQRLAVKVEPIEAIGYDGDVIEAQCFAYLALRSRRGWPLSLPTTTGAPAPLTGGVFRPASK